MARVLQRLRVPTTWEPRRSQEVEGDYVGSSGLQTFLEKLGGLTEGTFTIEPISVAAFGDELVVMHNHERFSRVAEA